MFNTLLRSILTRLSGSPKRNRPTRQRAAARRRPLGLHLEALEDRLTPSTLTVTSSADSGFGSLRAAIANASSGSTINFANNVHDIKLTTGELVISKNLDIEGPGASQLTISGNDASRVFDVKSGDTLTLASLTVANGLFSGPLPASMVGVFSGTGTGAGGGGGILNEAGATLNLNNDTISNNQAVHGSSPLAFTVLGGGILNLGTTSIVGCSFSNNEVSGGNGLDAIGGTAGGAIDNFGGPTGGATLTASNCTFSNNSSVAAGGGYFFGIGGALDSNGGLNGFSAQAEPSTATLTNCTISNNLATGGPDALANAGGLCNEGYGVQMTLVGCNITNNRAVGGGGGDGITTGDSEAVGGGIASVGTLTVVGCSITNNMALGGNNAILSDADPLAGSGFGGGIENNYLGVLNISNSIIANNVAQGGATAHGPGADAVGGGISSSPGATAMNMVNCVVANNSAIAGQGGPGVNSQLVSAQGGFAFGGGVDTSRSSTATIIGSLITGNSATGSAGGTGNAGGNGYGGGLGVGFGGLTGAIFSPDNSQLTVIASVVANNQAIGGMGGQGANGGNGYGGGLAVTQGSSATVTASVLTNNSAIGGEEGPGHGGADGKGVGGGEYNLGAIANTLSVITGNHASTSNDNTFGV